MQTFNIINIMNVTRAKKYIDEGKCNKSYELLIAPKNIVIIKRI